MIAANTKGYNASFAGQDAGEIVRASHPSVEVFNVLVVHTACLILGKALFVHIVTALVETESLFVIGRLSVPDLDQALYESSIQLDGEYSVLDNAGALPQGTSLGLHGNELGLHPHSHFLVLLLDLFEQLRQRLFFCLDERCFVALNIFRPVGYREGCRGPLSLFGKSMTRGDSEAGCELLNLAEQLIDLSMVVPNFPLDDVKRGRLGAVNFFVELVEMDAPRHSTYAFNQDVVGTDVGDTP